MPSGDGSGTPRRLSRRFFLNSIRSGILCAAIRVSKSSARKSRNDLTTDHTDNIRLRTRLRRDRRIFWRAALPCPTVASAEADAPLFFCPRITRIDAKKGKNLTYRPDGHRRPLHSLPHHPAST